MSVERCCKCCAQIDTDWDDDCYRNEDPYCNGCRQDYDAGQEEDIKSALQEARLLDEQHYRKTLAKTPETDELAVSRGKCVMPEQPGEALTARCGNARGRAFDVEG